MDIVIVALAVRYNQNKCFVCLGQNRMEVRFYCAVWIWCLDWWRLKDVVVGSKQMSNYGVFNCSHFKVSSNDAPWYDKGDCRLEG